MSIEAGFDLEEKNAYLFGKRIIDILVVLMQYFYIGSSEANYSFLRISGSENTLVSPRLIPHISPPVFRGSKYNIMLMVCIFTSRDMKFFFFSDFPILSAAEDAPVETLFFIYPYASMAAYVFLEFTFISAKSLAIFRIRGSNSTKSS